MGWYVFFFASAIVFLFSVVMALIRTKTRYKTGQILDCSKILFVGVIVSSVLLFIPVYYNSFSSNNCGVFETVFVAIHHMIRMFIVDSDYEFVTANISGLEPWLMRGYTVLFSVLFVLAPILTFGFVLSFFKNLSAYKRYLTNYKSSVFVFSHLNEKSLTLAKSLYDNNKKRLIVFTSVYEKEKKYSELLEKAKEINAICFEKDIVSINFAVHSKKSDINLFLISDNQSENITQSLKLINNLKYRNHTNLYVFSTQIEAEMILTNAFIDDDNNQDSDKKAKIKVRRVNDVRSLVMRNLYDNGYDIIFKNAFDDGSSVKKINAVVVGMGQHGIEMTKALAWFCQMDGYLAQITSFDKDTAIHSKFCSLCPELMELSGVTDIEGESKYTIDINGGVDVTSLEFDNFISALSDITYVFVALGSDEMNVATAVKIRSLCERLGYTPVIQAVIYNSEEKEALVNAKNFKGKPYNIDFIGDMRSSYSEAVILDSEVEEEALKRHLKWGDERSFWQYDNNYKSSVASAIHRKMKILCGIPGAAKDPKERAEDELIGLRILEHCRWNAYMRSEGYVYSQSTDKSTRNDMAKMHHCLVKFDDLPLEEQIKDDD